MKKFAESTWGIILFSAIPAVGFYIASVSDLFRAFNWERYAPLGYSIGIGLVCFGYFQVRKFIASTHRKIKEYETYQQKFEELNNYREKKREETIRIMEDKGKLWENAHAANRHIANLNELMTILMSGNSLLTRTLVNHLNGLETEAEIIKIVDSLYTHCHPDELEKIGVKKDIVNLMRARYHSEQLSKYESQITFNQRN